MSPLPPLLLKGDCIEQLKRIPDESVDAVVTDPPYGLEFGGESNGIVLHDPAVVGGFQDGSGGNPFSRSRVRYGTKMLGQATTPGKGRGLAGPLPEGKGTNSRGYADHDGHAFERWVEQWGRECLRILVPGGHVVAFGGSRTWHRLAAGLEDAGLEVRDSLAWLYGSGFPKGGTAATKREGWRTALKPAFEPIVLARKPLIGTVAHNLELYDTGALHTAAVSSDRIPANVLLDESQAELLGLPSRFMYVAKAPKSERPEVDGVKHPTVKPLALMRWLIRLVTPLGGCVVDPFAGSGTTLEAAYLEGRESIGIELTPDYYPLIEARIARALKG